MLTRARGVVSRSDLNSGATDDLRARQSATRMTQTMRSNPTARVADPHGRPAPSRRRTPIEQVLRRRDMRLSRQDPRAAASAQWMLWAGAAAALVLAIALVFRWTPPDGRARRACARRARRRRVPSRRPATSGSRSAEHAAPADARHAAADTGGGRVGLALAGGESLRLAAGTEVMLDAPGTAVRPARAPSTSTAARARQRRGSRS